MKLRDFVLERYFAKHEFSAKYMLSSSDCDGYSFEYLLSLLTEEELEIWKGMKFGYTESNGGEYLRSSISQFYKCTSEQIIASTPGELAFSVMNVLLESNDHVVCISPAYQSLYEVVLGIGCEISYWKPSTSDWTYDVEELASMVKSNTKLIIINFPHNPTGSYLTSIDQKKLIEIARRVGAWVYSDEMYSKIIHIGEELPPIADIYEKGISLWGLSKSFGLAGLRTGWIVCQDDELRKKVQSYKDFLSICNPTPSEYLSAFALNHAENFIQPNILKIRNNISMFLDFIKTSKIFIDMIPPRAGSIAMVRVDTDNTLSFSDELVAKTGIMTIPSEMFEMEGGYLRIGFGRESMGEIIEILKRI